MRIDVGSIIAVLKTAWPRLNTTYVIVGGDDVALKDYVSQLEAAHASPVQSILMDWTPEKVGVVRHEAGEK